MRNLTKLFCVKIGIKQKGAKGQRKINVYFNSARVLNPGRVDFETTFHYNRVFEFFLPQKTLT
jgi:hypothetical protein